LDAIVVITQHGKPLNEPAWELCLFATNQLLNSIDGDPSFEQTMQA